MPESETHQRLVQALAEWLTHEFCDGNRSLLLVDEPSALACSRPPVIGGCVPDVYARARSTNPLLIGEAKPARDVETSRTRKQLQAFLTECGRQPNSVLAVAVPWEAERTMKSLLGALKRQMGLPNVSIVVLEKLGG